MRTDPRPEQVREVVLRVLAEFGGAMADSELNESILIDRGRYVARSYRTEEYMAMWLVEVGIVQFYDAEGAMLATINLFETLTPQRMAA